MKIHNIKHILQFAVDQEGEAEHELDLAQFKQRYGSETQGANFYFGVVPVNRTHFHDSGKTAALHPFNHRSKLDRYIASSDDLTGPGKTEIRIVFALEPPSKADLAKAGVAAGVTPFRYVMDNLDLVGVLAQELRQYQVEAAKKGKRLEIVIRYASEMNDHSPGNLVKWAGDPKGFKFSFRELRQLFRERVAATSADPALPPILFDFSPAIRRDIEGTDLQEIAGRKLDGITGSQFDQLPNYWPGDDVVDIVSCTWYVGQAKDLEAATRNLRRYCVSYLSHHKPFAIDEFGGADRSELVGTGSHKTTLRFDNDLMLEKMLQQIEGFRSADASTNISFEHVTLFLKKEWGKDETLQFLL